MYGLLTSAPKFPSNEPNLFWETEQSGEGSSLSAQLSKPLHSFLLPLPAFVSPQDNAPGRSAHVPPLCAALAGSVLLKVVLSILRMGSRDRVAVSSFGSCWGREWTRMINTGVTAESRPACDPSQNMWMGKGNDGVALAL